MDPHLEFWIQPEDGHARVTFVNDDIEPIEAPSIPLSLAMGDRDNPTIIDFEQKGRQCLGLQETSLIRIGIV